MEKVSLCAVKQVNVLNSQENLLGFRYCLRILHTILTIVVTHVWCRSEVACWNC